MTRRIRCPLRLLRVLGGSRAGTTIAVVLQASLFGLAHAYQGARGIATTLLVGLVFGAWYALRGRSLVTLIIAHGVIDTVGLLAIYSGALAQ